MTIYLHKFSGVLPAGDIFNFGWHSTSTNSLPTANGLAATWITDLWSGTGGSAGLHASFQTETIITKATTTQLADTTPFRAVGVAETDLTLAGTNGTNNLPQDIAVVVTLRTTNPARNGRGRFYLPAPVAAELASNGELADTTIASFMLSLLNAWAATSPAGEHPVVFSRTSGAATEVTKFGIGTLFDIQRRRVNKVNTVRTFNNMP